ncbi:MAG: F0F1 ATP synthase subunit B [Pseudomonadota bacterium]
MAETAHTEVAGEVHADPSALGLDPTGWVALSMIAVFAIMLWKKVPAMIGAALDKQIAGIKEQLEAASKLRAEAEALKAEYEAKAKSAVSDAEAMKQAASKEADEIVAQARVDATALIARRSKMAEEKIAAAERAAIADVRTRAASLAASAAALLIADGHNAKADKPLIDETIARLN